MERIIAAMMMKVGVVSGKMRGVKDEVKGGGIVNGEGEVVKEG